MEGLAFGVPMVQKCFGTTDVPSIQGMPGDGHGVGVRREVRHRTMASATSGNSFKSMPTCVTETSVHLLSLYPFSGIQTSHSVAALTIYVHSIVSPPSLF